MTAAMPRGGPDASRLDRWYETDRPEYLDRPDTPREAARVRRGLDRLQRLTGGYDRFARWTLAYAGRAPAPRVLELGAGTGGLSRRVLHRHPAARVTVSDVEPGTVAALRAGPLGAHPRATVRRLDATAVDTPDLAFDVAVFAASLHHLPADAVRAVLREGTRVAGTLLLIDAWRSPLLCVPAVPLMFVTGGPAHVHDGLISLRKAYGAAAPRELAATAGPAPLRLRVRFGLPGCLVAAVSASG